MDDLHGHAFPPQVKPSKEVGGKVRARHHHFIARAKLQARRRDANSLRGAVGDRNFPRFSAGQSGNSSADALRQAKILRGLQPVRMRLKFNGLVNPLHRNPRERPLVGTVEINQRREIRKFLTVIAHR